MWIIHPLKNKLTYNVIISFLFFKELQKSRSQGKSWGDLDASGLGSQAQLAHHSEDSECQHCTKKKAASSILPLPPRTVGAFTSSH